MNLEQRIEALAKLGARLKDEYHIGLQAIIDEAEKKNPRFTRDNITLAFNGIDRYLQSDKLQKWTASYQLQPSTPKTVGVAMAGNIPLVGFHDYLCILISGHRGIIKLSSQDSTLLPYIHNLLAEAAPKLGDQIQFEERLQDYDAAIATGSNNTGRYFSYYFREVPHIIRQNRSSCAVLIGEETEAELEALGDDVFTYFGLGCRNVSKIYIPDEYDLVPLLRVWEKFIDIVNHNKYANNYNYQRSIHLINLKHFYDNGAVLLIESDQLVSPISVVYYERYSDQQD
ncbi:MAG: acyl-CoA reductase, partial [Cyclobacteriaceae bacterium]